MAHADRRFADRAQAGDELASAVAGRVRGPAVVLAIPRGGVIVAARVAERLEAPLDVVVPRKIGAPGNPELAVGAVAEGVESIDYQAVRRLGLNLDAVRQEAARQRAEVERRTALYRRGRPPVELADRAAVLVDDGVATGWTVVTAASWCRRAGSRRVLAAVPVGPPGLASRLRGMVDDLVVLYAPASYVAVGQAYASFPQVTDDEVLECLSGGQEG